MIYVYVTAQLKMRYEKPTVALIIQEEKVKTLQRFLR